MLELTSDQPAPEETPPLARRTFLGTTLFAWIAFPAVALLLGGLFILLRPDAEVTETVRSDPPGAVASLAGVRVGTTPLHLTGLKRGQSYALRLELRGFKSVDRTIVARRDNKPLVVALEPVSDPLLDEGVIGDLVGQIGEAARDTIFSHELANALFTVNPLIEQNPWLTDKTWSQIFRDVVEANFGGDSREFLKHLADYRAELARGQTSKHAWYQHLQACEKVCRPVVTQVFKRHIEWLRKSGFTMCYFPLNESALSDRHRDEIRRFVAAHDLATDRSRQVLLVGRASQIGTEQYNLDLSRKRVESVAHGIEQELGDGRKRLRLVHLGFEPPQLTRSVAEFLALDASLDEAGYNQSVMLIVSEPLQRRHLAPPQQARK